MTDKFKQECKKPAYANRMGKITYNETTLSNDNFLSEMIVTDGCYDNGNIAGTVISKSLSFKTLSNNDLADKRVTASVGVKYDDSSEEYIKMGEFVVSSLKNDETAKYGEYKGYDDLDKLNEVYECGITEWDNKTVRDIFIDLCNQVQLRPKNTSFINDNIPVDGNLFKNNETYKQVLSNIGSLACSYVDIDWEDNTIELKWLDSEVSEIITKDDYSSLEKTTIYGPINVLSIKESQIEGENAVIKDEESILQHGEKEFAIVDNFFLNTEEKRVQALDAIWNRIHNFSYVACKITIPTGCPYFKRGNKISVEADDETLFDTYVLNHTFTYNGAFNSSIEAPALTETNTKIKNEDFKTRFTRTEFMVDKISEQITSVIEEQKDQSNKISQVQQDIDSVQNLFQITGGSNDIKNSTGLFESNYWSNSESGEFERGYDVNLVGSTVSNSKIGIKNGKTQTNSDNIVNLMVGELRTLSFKLTNQANTTTKIKLIGNDTLIDETISEECELKEFNYQYYPDTPNLTLIIESTSDHDGWTYVTDLMSNAGDKRNWEPARDEIVGTVLKLSQLGLTVYCTGSDIATLMSAQGFQVREFRNNELYEVITEFTKDGINTKDILCTKIEVNKAITEVISVDGNDTVIMYLRSNN